MSHHRLSIGDLMPISDWITMYSLNCSQDLGVVVCCHGKHYLLFVWCVCHAGVFPALGVSTCVCSFAGVYVQDWSGQSWEAKVKVSWVCRSRISCWIWLIWQARTWRGGSVGLWLWHTPANKHIYLHNSVNNISTHTPAGRLCQYSSAGVCGAWLGLSCIAESVSCFMCRLNVRCVFWWTPFKRLNVGCDWKMISH